VKTLSLGMRNFRMALQDEEGQVSMLGCGSERITVSIGAGTASSLDEESPDALLHRVDEALYRAKAEGRNRVVLAAGESMSS